MNKIGTAHLLLSDTILTLPIQEENDGGGGLCQSWSATRVSSLSTTVVLLRLASASGKQIRDRGRCCRDECANVEGEEHERCGAVEKSILRWVQKMGSIQVYYSGCRSGVGWVG